MSDSRLEWLKTRPNACFKPFMTLSLRSHNQPDKQGIRHSCCCNLDVDYIQPGQETEFFDQLRGNIMQGKGHPACHLCYTDEANGAMSERIKNWLMIDDDMFNVLTRDYSDGSFEVYVKFSNSCPLACRSCDGLESSTYAKIAHQPVPAHVEADFLDDPANFARLKEIIQEAHDRYQLPILHVTGGEPLVQSGCVKLFRWMAEQGLSAKFDLRITTAWSINMDDEFAELIKNFRKIWFIISLDSVGKNYQYVRWPVKFQKIETNLARLVTYSRSRPENTVHVMFIPVISLNNAFYLENYLNYVANWLETYDMFALISMIHLYQPTPLKVENIPDIYRSKLLEIFERCQTHPLVNDPKQSALKYFVDSTVEQLKSGSGDAADGGAELPDR